MEEQFLNGNEERNREIDSKNTGRSKKWEEEEEL